MSSFIFESFRRRYNYLCREDEAHGPPVEKEPKKVRLEHSQGKENGGEYSWDKTWQGKIAQVMS